MAFPPNSGRPAAPSAPNAPNPGASDAASSGGDGGLSAIKQMGGMPERPFESMVLGINTAFSKMQELLQQEKMVPPEAIQELQGIQKAYQQFLVKLSNAGQAESGQPDQGQGPDQGPAAMPSGERVPQESGGRGIPVP